MEEKEKELLKAISYLELEDFYKVFRAYLIAERFHNNQYRKGGEPYLVHPTSVAIILAKFKEHSDLLCAALLHDTLEDTIMKKDFLIEHFGQEVYYLVDSVTKLDIDNFHTKREQNMYNRRKLLTRMLESNDVIKLKLVDRYHNLTTISALPPIKQQDNALEAKKVLVPFGRLLEEDYQPLVDQLIIESEKHLKRDQYLEELEEEYNEDYGLNILFPKEKEKKRNLKRL